MNASQPLPGAPVRRLHRALTLRRAPLEPRSARRFSVALACLGLSYALAWLELPIGQAASADAAATVSISLAAGMTARAIIGLLYVFVVLRHAWARWLTVVLGFASVTLVGPLLPAEWSVFPLGAFVTGLGLAGKLVAAVLLALPLRTKNDVRP